MGVGEIVATFAGAVVIATALVKAAGWAVRPALKQVVQEVIRDEVHPKFTELHECVDRRFNELGERVGALSDRTAMVEGQLMELDR